MQLLTINNSFHKDSFSVQKLIKFERPFHKTKLRIPPKTLVYLLRNKRSSPLALKLKSEQVYRKGAKGFNVVATKKKIGLHSGFESDCAKITRVSTLK